MEFVLWFQELSAACRIVVAIGLFVFVVMLLMGFRVQIQIGNEQYKQHRQDVRNYEEYGVPIPDRKQEWVG